jgi:hypothetical protein
MQIIRFAASTFLNSGWVEYDEQSTEITAFNVPYELFSEITAFHVPDELLYGALTGSCWCHR